ncbi:hypothetical protein [Klebsiella pneumoniae IS33]|nr:hypothetical protein [Klebsiella pneumoniae IS33]
MPKFCIARRQILNDAHGGGGFTHLRQRAVELLQREETRVRKGRGKGQHRRLAAGLEHLKDIGIDIDGFIASDLGRRRRLAELHRLGGNIITRLRTGDDAPLAFQQLIGMADGHKAHAAADHLLAQRRQPIARQPDAKGDLLGQLLRQLLILFHCGRPRTITSHYHISVIKKS